MHTLRINNQVQYLTRTRACNFLCSWTMKQQLHCCTSVWKLSQQQASPDTQQRTKCRKSTPPSREQTLFAQACCKNKRLLACSRRARKLSVPHNVPQTHHLDRDWPHNSWSQSRSKSLKTQRGKSQKRRCDSHKMRGLRAGAQLSTLHQRTLASARKAVGHRQRTSLWLKSCAWKNRIADSTQQMPM